MCNEIAYVLERDRTIEGVFVLDSVEGRRLVKKLELTRLGCRTCVAKEDDVDPSQIAGLSVVVSVMPASLHDEPKTILQNLGNEVTRLQPFCDSILFFYGLCRSTPKTIERFIEQWSIPVAFLIEENGDIPDDCFGSMLGGRSRYLEMMCNNRGTMFITPGYAEHWMLRMEDKPLDKVVAHIENYQTLFRSLGYNKIMMLENGLGDVDEFHSKVRIFASIFDFSVESVRCDLSIFERSYDQVRSKLAVPMPVEQRRTGEQEVSRTLP